MRTKLEAGREVNSTLSLWEGEGGPASTSPLPHPASSWQARTLWQESLSSHDCSQAGVQNRPSAHTIRGGSQGPGLGRGRTHQGGEGPGESRDRGCPSSHFPDTKTPVAKQNIKEGQSTQEAWDPGGSKTLPQGDNRMFDSKGRDSRPRTGTRKENKINGKCRCPGALMWGGSKQKKESGHSLSSPMHDRPGHIGDKAGLSLLPAAGPDPNPEAFSLSSPHSHHPELSSQPPPES